MICGIPVLLAVTNERGVRIFYTDELHESPIKMTNDEATWGLAAASNRPLAVVSANSFNITVYNLDSTSIERDKRVISGHQHNVPCISVSPDGKFIVSISIDQTIRIWHIDSGKQVAMAAFPEWYEAN